MSLSADIKAVVKRKGWRVLLGYGLEAFGLLIAFIILRILPLDMASALGGWVGRLVGPRLGVHKLAQKHMQRAYPEFRYQDCEQVLLRMWDHLGRIMGEFPHLHEFKDMKRITVHGKNVLEQVKNDKTGGIFVGGHVGNWEMNPIASAAHGMPMAVAFRNPNNPFVAAMLDYARRPSTPYRMPKGPAGDLGLARHVKKGGYLGLLVDQKLNEGIKLKFFGRDAMTAFGAARWAVRLKLPLILSRVKRLKGAHFEIFYERIEIPSNDDTLENTTAITQLINDKIEKSIRDAPSQWLWMHRRWVEEEK
jgi:KDO2-lipid IV(A) lauroyltransferase